MYVDIKPVTRVALEAAKIFNGTQCGSGSVGTQLKKRGEGNLSWKL